MLSEFPGPWISSILEDLQVTTTLQYIVDIWKNLKFVYPHLPPGNYVSMRQSKIQIIKRHFSKTYT